MRVDARIRTLRYLLPPGDGEVDVIADGLPEEPVARGKVLFLRGPRAVVPPLPAHIEAVVMLNPGRGHGLECLRQAGFRHFREYRLRPGLRELRWLLPAAGPAGMAGLQVYVPTSWRGHVLKLATYVSLPFGGSRLLLALREPPALESALAQILGVGSVRLALSTGTPGVYNKATGLVMAESGQILGYAKMAGESLAQDSLRNEVRTLRRLERLDAVRAQVPSVLGTLRHGSAEVVVTSPGPRHPAGTAFSPAHISFLRAIQQATGRTVRFGESLMWRSMLVEHAAVRDRVPPEWRSRLASAIAELEAGLCRCTLRMALAHRDLTPWNTRRLNDGRLYAFDWEFAREEYSPWYDYFHFHLMGSLLVKRTPSVRAAAGWVERARTFGGPRTELLFLAYLLDVALFYLGRRVVHGEDQDDAVLRFAADLLDRRLEWCGNGVRSRAV